MAELLDADFQRQVLAAFAAEAEERLQAITNHLLALEKSADAAAAVPLLKDIFREAHTLKGGARVLGLDGIEKITHRLETLFGLLQNGKLAPHQELFDLVYQCLDAIALLMREATIGSASPLDVSDLCTRLEQAQTQGAAPVADAQATAPAPAPPAIPVPVPVPEVSVPVPPPAEPRPSVSDPAVPTPDGRGPDAPAASRPAEESIRVAVGKLDALMADVGELQVTRSGADQRLPEVQALCELCETWETRWRRLDADRHRRLTGAAAARRAETVQAFLEINAANVRAVRTQLTDLVRELKDDSRRTAQILADLQENVRRVRMLPIATLFDSFPRMVRDLARDLGKEVTLTIQGGENEMDRALLEQIKGPLIHLVRNAVDHGLETPEARAAAGKPGAGSLTLTASQRGASILIELADDGAGIDVRRVKDSAVRKGWLTAEAAAAMGEREALWLIFRSGLSTKQAVTDLSGRGVGLDVVHEQVCRLNGLIDLESKVGQGTRFSLQLPLTVATTLCLLARAGRQTFAVPVTNVLRITRVRPGDVGTSAGHPVIVVDGRPLALTRLADVLGVDEPEAPAGAPLTALILGAADRRAALTVPEVLTTQEVVVKKLPAPLDRVPLVAGVTVLGTGEVVLVPNVAALLRAPQPRRTPAAAAEAPKAPGVIVVADDSVTTRMVEKNILEAAGYRVRLAADGLEAWNLLQDGGCNLLISDGEMPRLDGFGLTQKVRADPRLKDLPVILITSLDSSEDKERGVRAGADAYIVKKTLDQGRLLTTVGQLI
jgi:two-component system chemotaxis sensor kinase CheA